MNSTETSRIEELLKAILGMEAKLEPPQSRIEVLLWAILESGGGGGGTTNYNQLSNLPKINNVELKGNKTLEQLGLQPELTFDVVPTSGSNNPVKSGGIYTALAGKVDKVAGKDLSTNDYTTTEKTKLAGIEAGAEVNIITGITLNGEPLVPVNKVIALNVITKAVNDLQNYYLKTETYTKEEVNDLVNTISSLTLEIVETLPTTDISTTTIYLVPVTGSTNVYMQYAYIGGAWAQLGTTEVDLTNYYTKAQVDALLDTKEDLLTFDTVPTAGSDNPVTSGGIANALNGKQNALTFDAVPTENSTNPVESGGVYDALAGKQDALTFDTAPTAGSTNPVTSGGVAEALSNITVDVATTQTAGIVKPDGTTVTVDPDGTIHAAAGVGFDEEDFTVDDTLNMVSLLPKRRIFSGTTAEWEALTTAQKKFYGYAAFTDDEGAGYQEIQQAQIPLEVTQDSGDQRLYLYLTKIGKIVNATLFHQGILSGAPKTDWATVSVDSIPSEFNPRRQVYIEFSTSNRDAHIMLRIGGGVIMQYAHGTDLFGYEQGINVTWVTS